jgi:hypothetical protein
MAAVIVSRCGLEDSHEEFVCSFERQRDLRVLDRHRQLREWFDRTFTISERVWSWPDGILGTATVILPSGDDVAIVPIDVVGVAR